MAERQPNPGDNMTTQPGSRPVRYELIDKDGRKQGEFAHAEFAAAIAMVRWPEQEQDPDRTGKGWDVQVVGI